MVDLLQQENLTTYFDDASKYSKYCSNKNEAFNSKKVYVTFELCVGGRRVIQLFVLPLACLPMPTPALPTPSGSFVPFERV